jgi:hypothetical protein
VNRRQKFFGICPNNHVVTIASTVKGAIGSVERILLPILNMIDGELKVVNTRIDALDTNTSTKMDSLKAELRAAMTTNKNEIKGGIRALGGKVDILPRLAVFEAKMKELERK